MGQAVADGIIANETLAYFIARTYQYMIGVGILHAKLRFRQHMANEMAHYAQDCWDAEVETTYGWVECVGLADRSAFDLDAHTKATNVDLNAFVKYDKPIEKEVLQVTPVMKELGKAFKKEGTVIKEALLALEDSQKLAMQAAHAEGSAAPLVTCAGTFEITPEQVTIAKKMSKVTGRSFTPGVIEPSFGIGRIIYCMCASFTALCFAVFFQHLRCPASLACVCSASAMMALSAICRGMQGDVLATGTSATQLDIAWAAQLVERVRTDVCGANDQV